MNEERILIRKAMSGDEKAFASLYKTHYPQIFAMIARRTSDRDMVDDLVQTTFMRAFSALARFRGDSSFATWLTQIALNVHKSHLRAQSVRRKWVQEVEDPELLVANNREPRTYENPEKTVTQKQHQELVRKSIRALPARYRQAVWLRYVMDWSYEEITQTLQVPMGTVKTWLNRARHQLRGEFRKLGLQAV
jgi:RNA polymerase sigma-70 factor (ECF subfamily)